MAACEWAYRKCIIASELYAVQGLRKLTVSQEVSNLQRAACQESTKGNMSAISKMGTRKFYWASTGQFQYKRIWCIKSSHLI